MGVHRVSLNTYRYFPLDLLIFTVLLHTFGYLFTLIFQKYALQLSSNCGRSEFINPHCTDEREDVISQLFMNEGECPISLFKQFKVFQFFSKYPRITSFNNRSLIEFTKK